MSTDKQAFIFIGRSGCGKGTQAKLLIEKLKAVSADHPVFYIESGDRFRSFVAGTSHSSRLARAVMEAAERQPDFLAVWNWSHLLVENLMGDEHLVFDGTPRSRLEAEMLDTALTFYGYSQVKVVYVDISPEVTRERMEARGRADDKRPGDIEKRLAWFEKDVVPAINFYEQSPNYEVIRLNGEQAIEAVQAELMGKLGF
jgi:adenylate kinase family enzyme